MKSFMWFFIAIVLFGISFIGSVIGGVWGVIFTASFVVLEFVALFTMMKCLFEELADSFFERRK